MFDYHILWQQPWSVTAYSLLAFLLVFFYFVKNLQARLVVFLLALLVGWNAHRLGWQAFGAIAIFAASLYLAIKSLSPLKRGLGLATSIGLAIALAFHLLPGFKNWQVVSNMLLTPDAIPYSMWFNFDKPLIGIFFVWFSIYSLANGGKWAPTLKTGFLCGLAAMIVLLPLSFLLGYVKWEPKFTSFFFLWAFHNLFFTAFAEEALFRGLIQNTLQQMLQRFSAGKWLALGITAPLFGAAHFKGGMLYMILAMMAGLFYGYAFMRTQKIEAGILTHFMVNSVHFIGFTYPALKSAFP